MNKTPLVLFVSAVSAMLFFACSKSGEQEPAQTAQQPYSQPAYTQSTYDQGSYTTQPTTTATTATPAAASPMGGMAMQCTSDATCVTHRCNTATGRCAWPCQTNDDCQAGNQCIAPLCVPAGFAPAQ